MILTQNVVIGFIIAFVINQSSATRILDCPLGWETFNKFCYKFVFFPPRNFENARLACHVKGASLLRIHSLSEHSYISQWLQQFSPPSYQWYTDGKVNASSIKVPKWSSSSEIIPDDHQFWIKEYEKKQKRHRHCLQD